MVGYPQAEVVGHALQGIQIPQTHVMRRKIKRVVDLEPPDVGHVIRDREDQPAIRFEHVQSAQHELPHVVDVLKHLKRRDRIERAAQFDRVIGNRAQAEWEALRFALGDRMGVAIDAHDVGLFPRPIQEVAIAAADIQQPLARQDLIRRASGAEEQGVGAQRIALDGNRESSDGRAVLGGAGNPRLQRYYLTRSTCSNSSSTGVARPKIETPTLTRPRSKSSSSTTPLKLAKGPSSTFTASPIS